MKFDLFGQNIQLLFKGYLVHKTKLGQAVSITIAMIIVFRLIFLIIQAARREDPQLMYQERFVKDPEKFVLQDSSIQMAFGIMNNIGTYFHDPSLFTIQASEIKRERVIDKVTNEKKVIRTNVTTEVTTCTEQNFEKSKIQDYFISQNYSAKYCYKPNYNMTIEGDFNSDVFTSIYIHFKKCRGEGCKPIEEIDEILSDIMVDVAFSDVYVDPTKRENPFVPFGRDAFWRASSSKSSSVQFNLRNNYVESDDGWLLPNFEKQLFPSYNFNTIDASNVQTDIFLEIIIRLEKAKENLYQRRYKGILQLISEIGGFTNIFLAFGALICRKFAFFDFRHDLASQIFEIEDNNNNENDSKGNQHLSNIRHQNSSSNAQVLLLQQNQNQTNNTSQSPQIEAIRFQPLVSAFQSDSIIKFQNQPEQELHSFSVYRKGSQEKQTISVLPKEKSVSIFEKQSPAKASQLPKENSSPKLLNKKNNNKNNNNNTINNNTTNNNHNNNNNNDNNNINNNNNNNNNANNISILNQSRIPFQIPDVQHIIDDAVKEIQPELKSNQKHIKTMDFILSAICPWRKVRQQSKNNPQMNKQIQELNSHLDIKYIIQKLMEIDKLKKLLLNDEQIKLLDLFPKPRYYEYHQPQKNSDYPTSQAMSLDQLYHDKRPECQKMKEGVEALLTTITKINKNKIDQKVIQLIDKKYINSLKLQQIIQLASQQPQQETSPSEIQIDQNDQEVDCKFHSPDQSYFGEKIQSYITSNIFKPMPLTQSVKKF